MNIWFHVNVIWWRNSALVVLYLPCLALQTVLNVEIGWNWREKWLIRWKTFNTMLAGEIRIRIRVSSVAKILISLLSIISEFVLFVAIKANKLFKYSCCICDTGMQYESLNCSNHKWIVGIGSRKAVTFLREIMIRLQVVVYSLFVILLKLRRVMHFHWTKKLHQQTSWISIRIF